MVWVYHQVSHSVIRISLIPTVSLFINYIYFTVGILLHEMIKLMYHAKCKDPIFIRIGTCGGIGIEGGTVVITEEAVDGLLRNTYEMVIYRIFCIFKTYNNLSSFFLLCVNSLF